MPSTPLKRGVCLLSHLAQPLETLPKGRGLEGCLQRPTTPSQSSRSKTAFSREEKVAGLHQGLTEAIAPRRSWGS